jgi:DNA-binding CsgD family transcriptional regulator
MLSPVGREAVQMLIGEAYGAQAGPTQWGWFVLFESLARLLHRLGGKQRLHVILDDAHRLDSSSWLVLRELQRESASLPVSWIVTARDSAASVGPAARRYLASFRASRGVHVMNLAPLGRSALTTLAVAAAVKLDNDRLEAILLASGGNPLFMSELLRREEGRDASRLQELVKDQLRELPPETRKLIRRAALLGDSFALPELMAATGQSVETGLSAVGLAVESGILQKQSEEPECLGFRHQLFREAVIESLSSPDLAREAEETAWNLKAYYGVDAPGYAELLSALFGRGYSKEARRMGVKYGIRSCKRSCDSLAWEEAVRCCDALLEMQSHYLSQSKRVELFYLRGMARYKLGERYAALPDLERAFDFHLRQGEVEKLAAILAVCSYVEMGEQELVRMSKAASELLPSDSPEGVIARIYYGVALYIGLGEYRRGIEEMERAVAQAEVVKQENLTYAARAILAQHLLVEGRIRESQGWIDSCPTAPGPGFPDPRPYCNYVRAQLMLRRGEPYGARAYHEATLEVCLEQGDESLLGPVLQMAARDSLWLGEWETARAWAGRGIRHNRYAAGIYVPMVLACYQQGEIEAGVSVAHVVVRAGFAMTEFLLGDLLCGHPVDPDEVTLAHGGLAMGHTYSVLHPQYLHGALGALAWISGEPEKGEALLERALEEALSLQDAPFQAWLLFCLAQVDQLLGREGTPRFERAHQRALRLGMRPLARRLETQLLLSPRELEVLRLCDRGLLAKEIASILGIRVPTVQNHISRILSKTDTGNRIEALHWARRRGLLPVS